MGKKRNTKSKQMILTILEQADKALSQDSIMQQLDEKVDRATVYRILQAYELEGLIHKIIDDTGKWHYAMCESCTEGQHHDQHIHFKCTECESILCLDALVEHPALPDGYIIKNINYLISGRCNLCK